jgi:hypothetical protein
MAKGRAPSARLWAIAVVSSAVAGGSAYRLAPSLGGGPYEDEIVAVHVGDGAALQAVVRHGACEHGRRRIQVRETPTDVRMRVFGARPVDGGACIAVLITTRLTARLSSPLGDRPVLNWRGRRELTTLTP